MPLPTTKMTTEDPRESFRFLESSEGVLRSICSVWWVEVPSENFYVDSKKWRISFQTHGEAVFFKRVSTIGGIEVFDSPPLPSFRRWIHRLYECLGVTLSFMGTSRSPDLFPVSVGSIKGLSFSRRWGRYPGGRTTQWGPKTVVHHLLSKHLWRFDL